MISRTPLRRIDKYVVSPKKNLTKLVSHHLYRFNLTTGMASALEFGAMTKLLMVCMGNICRSPMAQAIGQGMAAECGRSQQFRFDSAGTHAHRMGERPDPRAQAALLRRGYKVGNIRSRRIDAQDFQNFDLILAMDASNAADLRRLCPPEHVGKIRLLLEFAESLSETEVPDPYYGNAEGFEYVLDLCEAGIRGLLRYGALP